MTTTITFTVSPTWTTVSPLPDHVRRLLYESLSYAESCYSPSQGHYEKTIRLFEPVRSRFPRGLTVRAAKILKHNGYTVNVLGVPPHRDVGSRVTTPDHAFRGKSLRPYQMDAVERAFRYKYGILNEPTGAGKTEIMAHNIREAQTPNNLIVVPSRRLHVQTIRRMKENFPEASVVPLAKDTTLDSHRLNIVVATYQALHLHSKLPWLAKVQTVHIDEGHRIAAETFKTAVLSTPNAISRIGYTATARRDDGRDMELTAWLGEVIHRTTYEDLIDMGHLVQPHFHTAATLEQALILTQGKPTIIFTELKETLNEHAGTLESYGVRCLTADHTEKVIKATLDEVDQGTLTHIACTPIMDEGLDLPRLECVIFLKCHSGSVRLTQRIGRAMRPYPGKTRCEVVDVIDKSYRKKLRAYLEEPAFARVINC